MDVFVLAVFILVYLGMILGGLPGLALDRTGVAVLGAIALLAAGRVSPGEAWGAIDVSTIGLLFGLMIVSAQFRLGGFYARVARRIAAAQVRPTTLLALLVAASGLLSAILANDIVCLAMTPLMIEGCARRGLNPLPYLLGLACASNVGSAATLIGNPQNMLIGQALNLSFGGYLLDGGIPALIGLVMVWTVIAWQHRGKWRCETELPPVEAPPFDSWQTGKAIAVTAALMAAFLLAPWPRDIVGLTAAGILLLSRRMATRTLLALVDWPLLVLFFGLFVVNHALEAADVLDRLYSASSAIHVM
ncbi:MAG TPA: SLC13 family permease [Acidobacteriota bacterium]|nr:SLC13 family permease [Acidobacteriota bacterium]